MQEFEIEYWINTHNGYDNRYQKELAESEQQAINKVKKDNPRGKNFKVYEN